MFAIRLTPSALAISLLALTITPLVTAAEASAPSCAGRPATIVGSDTRVLTGTPGDDVIVTDGANAVRALGGDDLVCVTRRAASTVTLGDGDDQYRGMASSKRGRFSTSVRAGAGADILRSGNNDESFFTGKESDPDVVTAGAGDEVESGRVGTPNPDRITVKGARAEVSFCGAQAPGGLLSGHGDTRLILCSEPVNGQWVVDLGAGTIGVAGAAPTTRFTGIRALSLFLMGDQTTVRGDRFDNGVLVLGDPTDGPPAGQMTVELGAGDDSVEFDWPSFDLSAHGGPGRDLVYVAGQSYVDLDLSRGRVVSRTPSGANMTGTVSGFEDVRALAAEVSVVGDDGPNNVAVNACRGLAKGNGGRDRLAYFADDDFNMCRAVIDDRLTLAGGGGRDTLVGLPYAGDSGRPSEVKLSGGAGRDRLKGRFGDDIVIGGPGKDTLQGGPGNDTLRGKRGPDLIIGGRGRDRAVGGPGRDRCDAEVRRGCELR